MSFEEKTNTYVRSCKQCGGGMTEPLKVKDKIYMFCSTYCRNIWDQEHAYRQRTQSNERISDADLN